MYTLAYCAQPSEYCVQEINLAVLWQNNIRIIFLEDFANDIELTEEEQIRLLEQYENETKQKKHKDSSPKEKKDQIGEKILFQKNTPQNSPSKGNKEGEGIAEQLQRNVSPVKIAKTDSAISLETVSSSSSDGDWEKVTAPEK